ncbi:YvcK family protein [Vallitaleaceae bacterium 9-2]
MYKNKRIVCIGGGTGLSTMLRGLKEYTDELTAIVTVADNGGHSGILRKEMNMLPPGDIRNCLLALAETEPIMKEVFQYRFHDGVLKDHNFGNLFLAALTSVYGSFEKAVEKANEVLAVKGQVLPVSMEDIQLKATYEDGTTVIGEHEIVYTNKSSYKRIMGVELVPQEVQPYPKAIEAILKADLVVLGPGSLYTSIIPNLLVSGVVDAIKQSFATIVYVGNIMTQPGETDGYTLKMHVDAIEKYLGKDVLQYIIADDSQFDEEVRKRYLEEHSIKVINDIDIDVYRNVITDQIGWYSKESGYIRHNAEKLAEIIIEL